MAVGSEATQDSALAPAKKNRKREPDLFDADFEQKHPRGPGGEFGKGGGGGKGAKPEVLQRHVGDLARQLHGNRATAGLGAKLMNAQDKGDMEGIRAAATEAAGMKNRATKTIASDVLKSLGKPEGSDAPQLKDEDTLEGGGDLKSVKGISQSLNGLLDDASRSGLDEAADLIDEAQDQWDEFATEAELGNITRSEAASQAEEVADTLRSAAEEYETPPKQLIRTAKAIEKAFGKPRTQKVGRTGPPTTKEQLDLRGFAAPPATASGVGPIVGGQFRHELNPDGTYTIFDVPIFATTKRGDLDYNEQWIDAAISRAMSEARDGHLPPMHLGHFEKDGPKPPEVGAFRITRKGSLNIQDEFVPVAFADLYVTDLEAFQKIQNKRLRYRSIEANFEEKRIRSLALLDSEPPFHKLPMTTVGDAADAAKDVPAGLSGADASSLVVGFSESAGVQTLAWEFPAMARTIVNVITHPATKRRYVTFSDGDVRPFTASGFRKWRNANRELFAAKKEDEATDDEKMEADEPGGEDKGSGDEAESENDAIIKERADEAEDEAGEEVAMEDDESEEEESMMDEIQPGEKSESDDEDGNAEDPDLNTKTKEEISLGDDSGMTATADAAKALVEALIDEHGPEVVAAAVQAALSAAGGEETQPAVPGDPQGAEVQGVPRIMREERPMNAQQMSELLTENRQKTAELVKFKDGVERKDSIRAAVDSLADRITGENIEAELTKFAEDFGVEAMQSHAKSLKASLPAVTGDDMEKFEEGAPRDVSDEAAKYRSKSPEQYELARTADRLFGDGSACSVSRERFIEMYVDQPFGS